MKVGSWGDFPPLLIAALCAVVPVAHVGGLLAALPLLLLVIPLVVGRYPGEGVLASVRERRRRPRPLRALVAKPSAPRVADLLRNRLLVAASLAERAPPLSPAR